MAQTPNQAIPYGSPADAPDVPYWLQRMAERVAALFDSSDTSRAKLPGQIVSGNDSITIAAGVATATKVITLPPGFSAPPLCGAAKHRQRGRPGIAAEPVRQRDDERPVHREDPDQR